MKQSIENYIQDVNDICEYMNFREDENFIKNSINKYGLEKQKFTYISSDEIKSEKEWEYIFKFLEDNSDLIYVYNYKNRFTSEKKIHSRMQFVDEPNLYTIILISDFFIYLRDSKFIPFLAHHKKVVFLIGLLEVEKLAITSFRERIDYFLGLYSNDKLIEIFDFPPNSKVNNAKEFLKLSFGDILGEKELQEICDCKYIAKEYIHWLFNLLIMNKKLRDKILQRDKKSLFIGIYQGFSLNKKQLSEEIFS